MRIINGLVYSEENQFEKKAVLIRDGFFASSEESPEEAGETVIDARDCYVLPGLIDIHFHGAMGKDFCDGTPEAVDTLAAYEAQNGITSICPAALTLGVEKLMRVLRCGAAFASGERSPWRADLIGINMEGPFISRAKKGAQNEAWIRPCDAALCRAFYDASGGLLRIIGLAPEENPEYTHYIREVKEFVRVSLAHTAADYETAMNAFRTGASHAVHLFNAMPEMTHREPGVVGAVRDCPHVTAELICDGVHVHPAVVRAAFDMLGAERIVLISDSLRAAGLGDGRIDLGGKAVLVKGNRAILADERCLAGSVTNLYDCMRTAVLKMRIPLQDAVRCASINPARVIGMDEKYGSIEPGKHGNALVVRKEDLSLEYVIKDGVIIRSRDTDSPAGGVSRINR